MKNAVLDRRTRDRGFFKINKSVLYHTIFKNDSFHLCDCCTEFASGKYHGYRSTKHSDLRKEPQLLKIKIDNMISDRNTP